MSKPFSFFPHERGVSGGLPAERELKSFFDDQPVNTKALETTPMPEEDLREGLDLPSTHPSGASAPEDPIIAELIRNHPNNVAKRQ